jgi:predicted nucleic acid-binding protein
MLRKVREKHCFSARIPIIDAIAFANNLSLLSIQLPNQPVDTTVWTRDPKDDVLISIALAAGVDYLVSGDKDLLVIGDTIAPLKLRSPQAFLDEIDGEPDAGLG